MAGPNNDAARAVYKEEGDRLTAELEAQRVLGAAQPVDGVHDVRGQPHGPRVVGHSAGDDLLARLGRALAMAVESWGRAYRLGGDEFCVHAPTGHAEADAAVDAAAAALTEHGTGFRIDASYGSILLPAETRDAAEALRLVDQRMYAQKRREGRSADRQSKDVLLHALYERNPQLYDQLQEVGALIQHITDWSQANIGTIRAARENFDARTAEQHQDPGPVRR